jgi:hypothetical protein
MWSAVRSRRGYWLGGLDYSMSLLTGALVDRRPVAGNHLNDRLAQQLDLGIGSRRLPRPEEEVQLDPRLRLVDR